MIRTAVIAAALAIVFTSAHAAQPLTVKVYNAGAASFNVNSTLVYGEKEAMVIDAGFTRADALRIVRDLGLTAAADRIDASDAEVLAANAARIQKARGLMQTFGAQGVPALVVSDNKGSRLLNGNALYGNFDTLLSQIVTAG
jgi:hypothetical protein